MVNKPLRVLHVLPTRAREYGGPVAVAEALVEESRRQGMRADIYPPLPDECQHGALPDVREAVRRSDVVHIHGLWNLPATKAAMAARRHGIPYVLTPHGMLDRWALNKSRLKKAIYGRLFERRNVARAAGVHFLNDEELDEARAFGVPLQAFVLPNGVFTERFASLPAPDALLAEHPVLRGKVIALFLGRIHPKKGFDILVPALAKAMPACPTLHLLVAGPDEGGYRAVLEGMLAQHGLSDRVTFLGMVRDQKKLETLSVADFFVLPSHQEGDSVAVKEAMASGLPVVVTPACHFPQVAQEQAGLVVPPDIQALADALRRLAQDAGAREAMGQRARGLVASQYTWSAIVKTLQQRYAAMVGQKGHAGV